MAELLAIVRKCGALFACVIKLERLRPMDRVRNGRPAGTQGLNVWDCCGKCGDAQIVSDLGHGWCERDDPGRCDQVGKVWRGEPCPDLLGRLVDEVGNEYAAALGPWHGSEVFHPCWVNCIRNIGRAMRVIGNPRYVV